MTESQPIHSLEELVQRLCATSTTGEEITIGQMLCTAGRRSFGPLLLVLGLIVLSPLSGIPGLPTAVGVLVLLVSAQLLFGRSSFWLPSWLLCRKASSEKLQKALRFMSPIARFADRLVRPRLRPIVHGKAVYGIALVSAFIALTMPPLELLPFANSAAGAMLTIFGLALIGEDGLLAAIAATLWLAGMALLVVHLAPS